MNRNDPDKSMLLAELLERYSGHISHRTGLEQFADFVTDVDVELERMAEEDAGSIDLDDEVEEEPEDEIDADAETE